MSGPFPSTDQSHPTPFLSTSREILHPEAISLGRQSRDDFEDYDDAYFDGTIEGVDGEDEWFEMIAEQKKNTYDGAAELFQGA